MTHDNITPALETLVEVDAYKLDHRRQYPPGTEYVFSNFTARGTRLLGVDRTVFFGLQAILDQLNEKWDVFFSLSSDEVELLARRYEEFTQDLLGTIEKVGFDHFRELHALGYLPLRIKAFREGSLVPLRVPYLTIENTDSRFFWLTNYLETTLSAELWQPITAATVAWRARRMLDARATESGVPTDAVDYQGHDFSYRGMESTHAASASSAGHLLSFKGTTDTLPAIRFVQRHYGGGNAEEIIGRSVHATEHSVMTAQGEDGEFDVISRLLDTYPAGMLSLVLDSYDLWRALTEYLPKLKDTIMSRDGKLVVRPDSGDPEKILLGDPNSPENSPAYKGVVNLLAEEFGTTVNAAGFKELDSHIGIIYGDSITYERADAITAGLIEQGYASTTVTMGFGSFSYQYQTRDTFGMAVKATWIQVNGVGRDIFKNPVTDDGTKKSATGRLAVRSMMNGTPYLIEHASTDQEEHQILDMVYENGKLFRHQSFTDVRNTLRVATEVYERTKP